MSTVGKDALVVLDTMALSGLGDIGKVRHNFPHLETSFNKKRGWKRAGVQTAVFNDRSVWENILVFQVCGPRPYMYML